jgi:hypothetical protein
MRILDGEDASAIPVTVGNTLKPIFDWRQLQLDLFGGYTFNIALSRRMMDVSH